MQASRLEYFRNVSGFSGLDSGMPSIQPHGLFPDPNCRPHRQFLHDVRLDSGR